MLALLSNLTFAQTSKEAAQKALGNSSSASEVISIIENDDPAEVFDAIIKLNTESKSKILKYYEMGKVESIKPARFKRGIRSLILGLYEEQRYPASEFLIDYNKFKKTGDIPNKSLPDAFRNLERATNIVPSSKSIFQANIEQFSKIQPQIEEVATQKMNSYNEKQAAKGKEFTDNEALKYANLAYTHFNAGKFDDALTKFRIAADLNGGNIDYKLMIKDCEIEIKKKNGPRAEAVHYSEEKINLVNGLLTNASGTEKKELVRKYADTLARHGDLLLDSPWAMQLMFYNLFSRIDYFKDKPKEVVFKEWQRFYETSSLGHLDIKKSTKQDYYKTLDKIDKEISNANSFCDQSLKVEPDGILGLKCRYRALMLKNKHSDALIVINKIIDKSTPGTFAYYSHLEDKAGVYGKLGQCGEHHVLIDSINSWVQKNKEKDPKNIGVLEMAANSNVCPENEWKRGLSAFEKFIGKMQ